MGHIMVKDLQNIKVKGSVHIWHCVDNNWKSLTNDYNLLEIERLSEFDTASFVEKIAEGMGFIKDGYYSFKDGFAVVDHYSKTGLYIISDGWSKEVETVLLNNGYILKDS